MESFKTHMWLWRKFLHAYLIPHAHYRTSIKALVLDNQKRFLLTKDNSGKWDLPGGGLDFSEHPQACISREILEEMGIETTWIANNPCYFLSSVSDVLGKGQITNIIYVTKLKDLKFTPSAECVEIGFFSAETAKQENLYSNVTKFAELYDPLNH